MDACQVARRSELQILRYARACSNSSVRKAVSFFCFLFPQKPPDCLPVPCTKNRRSNQLRRAAGCFCTVCRRGAGVRVDRQRCARRFSRFDNRHFGVPAGKVSDRYNPTPDFPTDRYSGKCQILNRSKRQGRGTSRNRYPSEWHLRSAALGRVERQNYSGHSHFGQLGHCLLKSGQNFPDVDRPMKNRRSQLPKNAHCEFFILALRAP
jgi:hypothetical protein